jgi:hypothetical protein
MSNYLTDDAQKRFYADTRYCEGVSSKEQERKELFKQVAIVWLRDRLITNPVYDSDLDTVRQTTEAILVAADKFSKEGK